MNWREVELGYSPPRRGGVDAPSIKWICSEIGAAGVARSASPIGRSLNRSSANLFRPEDFAELTTPSAAHSVASQLLIDAAATPPLRGGEYSTFNTSSIRSQLP